MSDPRLDQFSPVLADACDALLGFADPVAARTLVDRMLVAARAWPVSGREELRSAIVTLQRAGGVRRKPFAEALIAGERARLGAVRAAAEVVRAALIGAWAAEPAIERTLGFDHRCLAPTPLAQPPDLEVVTFERDHTERAEVVIVGSGAAGGVLAHELSGLGLGVVVLEAGPPPSRLRGAPLERVRRGTLDANLAMSSPTPIRLWAGAGVGGSTRGWFGTMSRASDDTLRSWVRDTGFADLDPEPMRRRFDRIDTLLSVGPIDDALFGENANAVGAGAVRSGLSVIPERRAAPGCGGCGTCMAGCPTGALAGSATHLLPIAQRGGTQIIANARVERILVEGGSVVGVEAAVTDDDGRALAALRVDAPIVILAAGALRTPQLLVANALGTRSGIPGRGMSLRPSVWVAGAFDGPLRSWRGVAQTLRVDAPEGVRIQATAFPPGLAATLLPGVGLDLRRRIQAVETVAGILVSARDEDAPGRVVERGVRYRMSEQTASRLAAGIQRAGQILFEAGAPRVVTGLVQPGLVRDREAFLETTARVNAKSLMRLLSTEPSGGCRPGADPTRAVVDATGQVHGVPGLFVADASALPGPLDEPPAATVMALALRISEFLATDAPRFLV